MSELAGRIAHTEDEVARVQGEIAKNGDSTTAARALAHARRARAFAEHERHEQERWSANASRIGGEIPQC